MVKTSSGDTHFSDSDAIKLPPLRSLEPMSIQTSDNSVGRGPTHPPPFAPPSTPMVDERNTPLHDRPALDSSTRMSLRHAAGNGSQTQGGYRSPSPPPPAPLSNLSGSSTQYETHNDRARTPNVAHAAYGTYSGNRGAPNPSSAISPWSSTLPASETNLSYSLERIHASSLSLYNSAGEHLERQIPPTADELYSLLPIVSEINQELRALLSAHGGRGSRDEAEVAPYYPWTSGNNGAPPYWVPGGRDERDGKGSRIDEGLMDDKEGHDRRRKSTERAGPRMGRTTSSEDLGSYAANMSGQQARSDHMYMHPSPYPPHAVGPAKSPSSDSVNGQYVPKYRKRSRAPAPGICHACGSKETPEWRRGPDGARTLCNACGLHFSKLVRRRTQEYANAAPGTHIPPVAIEELRVSSNVNGAPMTMADTDESSRARGPRSSTDFGSAPTPSPPHYARRSGRAYPPLDLAARQPSPGEDERRWSPRRSSQGPYNGTQKDGGRSGVPNE